MSAITWAWWWQTRRSRAFNTRTRWYPFSLHGPPKKGSRQEHTWWDRFQVRQGIPVVVHPAFELDLARADRADVDSTFRKHRVVVERLEDARFEHWIGGVRGRSGVIA